MNDNERIKHLIVRVGDEGPEFYKRDIAKLVESTIKYHNTKDQAFRELMFSTYLESIETLIIKSQIYASAVGQVSASIAPFVETLTDKIIESLQRNLDKGNLLQSKALLLFLGELMNTGLINGFAFISLLDSILQEADNSMDKTKDFYLYLVVNTIPYVLDSLNDNCKIELKNLLDSTNSLMGKRHLAHLKLTRVFRSHDSTDRLSLLWKGIQQALKDKPKQNVHRAYTDFQDALSNLKQLNKKNLKLTFNNKSPKCVYKSPNDFSLFDDSTLIKEAGSLLEKMVIREQIVDTIFLFMANSKMLQQFLIQFNTERSVPHLIIETLVGEILRLPNQEVRTILYTTVILGLAEHDVFKKIIEETFVAVTKNIEDLDTECTDRFIELMAMIITNEGTVWNWKLIEVDEKNEAKQIFLRSLFHQMFRLSSPAKMAEHVPAELKSFVPAEPKAHFKYSDPTATFQSDAEILNDRFAAKASGEDMLAYLQSGNNGLEASGDNLLDLFINCLLFKASKSLTHLDNMLERYSNVLSTLASTETDQYFIINAVKTVWANSPFHIETIIDRMLNLKVLQPKAVINHIFKQIETKEDEHNHYHQPFALLNNLLAKLVWRARNLSNDLSKARAKNDTEVLANQGQLDTLEEENRQIFLSVFKRFHKTLTSKEHKLNNAVISDRLKVIARRFHKEIEPVLSKITEEFKGQKDILATFKELGSL